MGPALEKKHEGTMINNKRARIFFFSYKWVVHLFEDFVNKIKEKKPLENY